MNLSSLPSVPISERRNLPASAGVYLVLSGTDTVVYVGKGKNIRTRWIAHHRLYDASRIIGARIAWIEVQEPAEMSILKEALIEQFNPPLNVMRRAVERIGFLVRIPASLHADLKGRAREHGHSLNTEIDRLLRRALEERNRQTT